MVIHIWRIRYEISSNENLWYWFYAACLISYENKSLISNLMFLLIFSKANRHFELDFCKECRWLPHLWSPQRNKSRKCTPAVNYSNDVNYDLNKKKRINGSRENTVFINMAIWKVLLNYLIESDAFVQSSLTIYFERIIHFNR